MRLQRRCCFREITKLRRHNENGWGFYEAKPEEKTHKLAVASFKLARPFSMSIPKGPQQVTRAHARATVSIVEPMNKSGASKEERLRVYALKPSETSGTLTGADFFDKRCSRPAAKMGSCLG